jgi:L-seryl-tRNA(Ser) seleniumtransferase
LLAGRRVAAEPFGATAAQAPPGLPTGSDLYRSIGVRPFVNARGTYTILTGSTMLPEARAAMGEASKHYVHLDELAEAIGRRLAELTRAEWGMVTNGCSAALTHATGACVTGGNPDLHVRVPDLRGFPRDECVIPKHSRNVYDAAVRAVGVRVVEVATAEELEAALGPRTALVYVLAGPMADEGPLRTQAVAEAAKRRGVPVLVDAAAEVLTVPNVHLQLGVDLVAYSGGKCLRGPQAAGLLLGRKDLVKAAWVGSAPHHGFARGYKVGKEEAMAMLAAVEAWTKRDYEAEIRTWASWVDAIAKRVGAIEGVRTSVTPPAGLSNRMPVLQIRWDEATLGTTGEAVAKLLFETEPRISVFPARGRSGSETGLTIGPYMMAPGDEKVVAERLFAVLSSPPRVERKPRAAPAADLTGTWDVRIQYAASASVHRLHLRQRGNDLDGVHQGDFVSRDLAGTIDGDAVLIRSHYPESHGDALHFTFTGRVSGDEMTGELDMGEYLGARFAAKRHGGPEP